MARLTKLALPTSKPTEGPLKSICINEEWLTVIMNTCTRLEWPSSWTPETDPDAAEQGAFQLYALFRNAQEGCEMNAGELRQRPDECGVLEQWNGVEWVEIADFAACFPPIPGPQGPPGPIGPTGSSSGGNQYPPRPTSSEPDKLCNAASYILDQIRKLMSDIIADLATIEPGEILAGLLGIGGWRASALYLLVGQLDAGAGAALLEEFDDSRAALLCALVDEELSQDALLDFVETGLPASLALKDALTQAITAALDNGQYAIWAFVGSTMTGADCSGCIDTSWCFRIDFTETSGVEFGLSLSVSAPGIPSFSGAQWENGVGLKNVDTGNRDRVFASYPGTLDITSAALEWEYETGGAGNIWLNGDFGAAIGTASPTTSHTVNYTSPVTNLIFGGERPGSDFTPFIILKAITFRGENFNPFGESNC